MIRGSGRNVLLPDLAHSGWGYLRAGGIEPE
jgi:hypothetical protein